MILHQRSLDYNRHCQYALGTYVQAHDEPKHSNTNAPRSLDCIYLRYTDNVQGGHEFLHLQTNSVLTRRRVTPVPITPAIIKQVHMFASVENMSQGLKIENKTGQVFYDSAWIAGVDYDEEAFDDDLDDDYEDDYEDDDANEQGDDDNDDLPPGHFEEITDVDDDDEAGIEGSQGSEEDGEESLDSNGDDEEDDDKGGERALV